VFALILIVSAYLSVLHTHEAAADATKVVIVFQSQRLPDKEAAKLLSILASASPKHVWRRTHLRVGEGVEALVNRVYQYFGGSTPGAMPLTAQALAGIVQEANPHLQPNSPENTPVLVPPLPVRPYSQYDFPSELRLFDTADRSYRLSRDLNGVGAPVTEEAPPPSPDILRKGTSTAIVTALTPELRAALPTLEHVVVLPVSGRAPGFTRLQLLQDPPTPCEPLDGWLLSPYRLSAVDRLEPLKTPPPALPPLVIVDADFTGNGHGAKVLSVAKSVLKLLGLEAALASNIRTVDFAVKDPDHAANLHAILTRFSQSDAIHDALSDFVKPAHEWIDGQLGSGADEPDEVPIILLQAVLWDSAKQSSFLSLSFRFEDPVFQILTPAVKVQKSLFAIVAAGNESSMLPASWSPQDAASTRGGFVNVTYGNIGGAILGCRTNPGLEPGSELRIVSIVAPGCGFQYGAVTTVDEGSSLAAPFVAVASWIRHLLDGTPPEAMRTRLMAAATLFAGGVPASIEAGRFDLWRFLSGVGSHVVTSTGTIIATSRSRLEITGNCPGLGAATLTFTPEPAAWKDFFLYERNGAFTLLMRRVPGPAPNELHPLVFSCDVSAIRFVSDQLTVDSLAKYVQQVRYMSMTM
jgi:hypothetical protein